jgi:hypothetical protein
MNTFVPQRTPPDKTQNLAPCGSGSNIYQLKEDKLLHVPVYLLWGLTSRKDGLQGVI